MWPQKHEEWMTIHQFLYLELSTKLLFSFQVEDKDGRFLINFNKTENSDSSGDEKAPDLISEAGRRELLRQKWEKEEEENIKKSKLHYNDVLFDEARTHGAAFYGFSRDEDTRFFPVLIVLPYGWHAFSTVVPMGCCILKSDFDFDIKVSDISFITGYASKRSW